MDSAVPLSPASQRPIAPAPKFTRFGWVLIAAALIAYGILLARNMGAYAGGSDSSGYMNHARLLGRGHVHVIPNSIPELAPADTPDWLYSALGFKIAPDRNGLVPTYPTGLPLFVLGAAQVVGWNNAGNVVLWLHAMAGAFVMYQGARAFGLSRRAGVIAAVAITGSPVYLFMSVQAMSDVPALVWTSTAIIAAWRSRERVRLAAFAGLAFAIAVLIRPTNFLAIVPVALALGFAWRNWLLFGLGGLPGAIFFCLHSHAAYGSYFTTGYGDSAGLEAKWIGVTLLHYARWLPMLFTPLVIAFLALPAVGRARWREGLVLGAWFLVFAGFYSAYSCTHETWWYLRFLLPAAPALVIGGLLVVQTTVTERLSCRGATFAACAALIVAFGTNTYWSREFSVLDAGRGEQTYPMVTTWLKEHLPANAVVAAMQHSGALYYYTDFVFIRWDNLDPKSFSRVAAALAKSNRPLYAALSPFEIDEQNAFTRHMPEGRWEKIGNVRDVTLWRWHPAAATAK